MDENIQVSQKVLDLVWEKSNQLSKHVALVWKDIIDSLPDDDDLATSACMQMFVQAIVILMSTNTALSEDDYIEHLCKHIRDVHAKIHHTVRDRVRVSALKELKDGYLNDEL